MKVFSSTRKAHSKLFVSLGLLVTLLCGLGMGEPAKVGKTRHWYQVGRASWYGNGFQGQPTASGETYDMKRLTAAHRSLPLGSLIRVTNLRNHKAVIVKVNDRGPMVEDRVLDLSYRAAQVLGFSHNGLAAVKIELVDKVQPAPSLVAQLRSPVF